MLSMYFFYTRQLHASYGIARLPLIKLGMIGIALLMISCLQTGNVLGKTAEPLLSKPSKVINITTFGAVGDGKTDDTVAIQAALTRCSRLNQTCEIPKGKKFLVRSPLFIWGGANLVGEDGSGTLTFDIPEAPYLFNVGISARQRLEKPFSGKISKARFVANLSGAGRIIFLWRTKNATISDNTFEVGEYAYSATSSGNDNAWVKNGFKNCIRENITIVRNKIIARATAHGSEGIGLGHFDGAMIQDNEIIGVGDDPIAIHFSRSIKILDNTMRSVDGRIFVSNSVTVEIARNSHERMASPQNGKFYKGISLLYIGFESHASSKFSAPTNIDIHHNRLYYPNGAVDHGAAIYLYGVRDTIVQDNQVMNDSALVTASGLHLLPVPFRKTWTDPTKIDPGKVARVRNVTITDNINLGTYPLGFQMTGNCIDYQGQIKVHTNTASRFQFYCNQVAVGENVITAK